MDISRDYLLAFLSRPLGLHVQEIVATLLQVWLQLDIFLWRKEFSNKFTENISYS